MKGICDESVQNFQRTALQISHSGKGLLQCRGERGSKTPFTCLSGPFFFTSIANELVSRLIIVTIVTFMRHANIHAHYRAKVLYGQVMISCYDFMSIG